MPPHFYPLPRSHSYRYFTDRRKHFRYMHWQLVTIFYYRKFYGFLSLYMTLVAKCKLRCLATSQCPLVKKRLFYRAQRTEKRRRGSKTILKSGQGWTLPALFGQLKQNKMERSYCEVISGVPTILQGYWID